MTLLKKNWGVLIISCIHFILFLLWIPYTLSPTVSFHGKRLLLFKIISFLLMLAFWKIFLLIFRRVFYYKDKSWVKASKIFFAYFFITLSLLILIWPGVWIWDEFFIYNGILSLKIGFWHHYLTSIQYLISYIFFPFAGGIVVFQLIVIASIVSYIIYDLSKKTKFYYLAFLIFLFPSILYFNIYPMRVVLYAYILLFTVYYILFTLREKQTIHFSHIIPLLIGIPILSTWRAEGIIILPFLLLSLYLILKNKITLIKKIQYFIAILSLFYIINFPQKIWDGKHKDYTMTAFLNPLSMLLQYDSLNKFNEVKDDLSALINLSILKSNADFRETPAFWYHKDSLFVSNNISDFKKFQAAYFKLILYNPQYFFKARLKTFMATSGWINDEKRRTRSAAFNINNNKLEVIQNFSNYSSLNNDFFPKSRIKTIHFLEGSNQNNPDISTPIFHIFWNLIIVFLIHAVLTLISLFRKDWIFFTICSGLWFISCGIFCTAPASYFMYYFPVYLVTYIMAFSSLVDINKNGWRKKIN